MERKYSEENSTNSLNNKVIKNQFLRMLEIFLLILSYKPNLQQKELSTVNLLSDYFLLVSRKQPTSKRLFLTSSFAKINGHFTMH